MDKLPDGVTIQDYLFNVDVHKLLNNVDNFRKLNLKKMSRNEIRQEIMNVLLFDDRSVLLSYFNKFEKGTLLFRIRNLRNSEVPNKELEIIQDVWNPPNRLVKRQRLNKPHESLLYACFDVETAIEETKTCGTDSFALIIYEAIDEIKAVRIGSDDDFSTFNNDEKLKLRILNSFLKEEFVREAGQGYEHLYKVSEIIAKDYFDLPPGDVQDAWCYPSVANKPSLNICFRPDIAMEKLVLKDVLISDGYVKNNDDFHLNLKAKLEKQENNKLLFRTLI